MLSPGQAFHFQTGKQTTRNANKPDADRSEKRKRIVQTTRSGANPFHSKEKDKNDACGGNAADDNPVREIADREDLNDAHTHR
jgi:hypothetical protein